MPSSNGPRLDWVNAWTLAITPLRVMNVPTSISTNVAQASTRLHTRRVARRCWTAIECISAVAVSHGRIEAFSTGSQAQ